LANQVATGATLSADIASLERGWIAPKAGVVNLIWLVILVLMVWQPQSRRRPEIAAELGLRPASWTARPS
jgi:hypothetical protein